MTQPNKKQSSPIKSPSRKSSSLMNVSIYSGSKSSLRRLQQAIRRHQSVSKSFDESLPEDNRFQGILTNKQPQVQKRDHAPLSPFVLELRVPQHIHTEEESVSPVLLNLLSPDLLSRASFVSSDDTTEDLLLQTTDFTNQLSQPFSPSVWSKSNNVFSKQAVLSSHTQNIPLQDIPSLQKISIDTFATVSVPQNILSYFDLPETEEVDEQDPEELVELTDLLVEETEPEIVLQTPSFFERVFSSVRLPMAMPQGWQRAIGVFVLISFVIVLPLHAMSLIQELHDTKSKTLSNSTEALDQLKNAVNIGLVTDPLKAESNFKQASAEFANAQASIDGLGAGVKLILSSLTGKNGSFKTNRALLKIGEELSLAGAKITDGLAALSEQLQPTPSSRIELLQLYFQAAQPHLVAATEALKDVNPDVLDASYKNTFEQLASTLPSITTSNQEFLDGYQALSEIMGAQGSKHYLLVFQNNTEMRATGGFMGSYADVTVHDGMIDRLDVPGGGTYDLQGWLREQLVSPWPLQLVSARWEFQDANWFPDFPTSARQMLQFYHDAGGADVDGVIAINASFVERLLGLVGSVDMNEYGTTIDEKNFLSETQKMVETNYDKTANKPKAFIGDLAPKLLEKTKNLSPEQFLSFADLMNKGLTEKDVQIYFTKNDLQKVVLAHGWGGTIQPSQKDYLMVVNTNIGGGKTDRVIEEHVDVDVTIDQDGSIRNRLTIKRAHTGVAGTEFSGVNNVNFLRVYVPKGSTLLSAKGFNIPRSSLFEIPDEHWVVDKDLQYANESYVIDPESKTQTYEENGKTVFGNWTQTKPGSESTVVLEYRLPFTLASITKPLRWMEKAGSLLGDVKTDVYTLMVQKQSGVTNRETVIRVCVPDNLKTDWSSGEPAFTKLDNSTDHLFGMLFEPAL